MADEKYLLPTLFPPPLLRPDPLDRIARLSSFPPEAEQDKLPNVKAERTKFDELTEDLLRDYRIHDKRSIRRAKMTIEELKKFFRGCRAHDISTTLIDKYVDKRKAEGLANSSINRELAILKRAFSLLFYLKNL